MQSVPLGRGPVAALVLVIVVLTTLVACTPAVAPAVAAWDDEVVGVMAQTDDVLAVDVLPSMLGKRPNTFGGLYAKSGVDPDPVYLAPGCRRLSDVVAGYDTQAAAAPSSREAVRPQLVRLARLLRSFADECIAATDRHELTAFITDRTWDATLHSAGDLEKSIGRALHRGATCPKRLQSTVRTCRLR